MMVNVLKKPFAFIKRDFLNEISYRLSFIMQVFGILVSVLTFYFLARLFGQAVVPYLKPYGGDYFSFVIIGVAFSNYQEVAMNSLSRSIRDAQMTGTLEALLVTQTEIPTIILSSSLYSFIFTSLRVFAYLLLGSLFFGMDISHANFFSAVIIFILTIVSLSSFGIISASFVMVFKRGDPITWLLVSISWFLGGVYYPISVLPPWLLRLSYLLPITHSLEGMRLCLLKGASLAEIYPNVLALLAFSVITLPISVTIFRYAVNQAKKDGSLTQY
jgi:ABC-2 type transport system permease protein